MNDQSIKYPIYWIQAEWIQNGDQSIYDTESKWVVGLPAGRIRNSTGFHKMFKEEQTEEQLDQFIKDWWNIIKLNNNSDLELIELKVKYKEHETWNLTWFCHETIDVGQSDEEALQSFEEFVRRYEHQQNRYYDEYPENYHCLMGAEDRWRWYGYQENDGNRTPAPCRCDNCKSAGMIRITH